MTGDVGKGQPDEETQEKPKKSSLKSSAKSIEKKNSQLFGKKKSTSFQADACSNAGGASSSSAVPAEPSSESAQASSHTTKSTDIDMGKDMIASFIQGGDPLLQQTLNTQQPTKDRFMQASLIVPAICLKKFKMAINEEGKDGKEKCHSHAAVLGASYIKQYRTERKTLAGMVIGDVLTTESNFWNHCVTHLGKKKVLAILVSDQFKGTLEQVSCLILVP